MQRCLLMLLIAFLLLMGVGCGTEKRTETLQKPETEVQKTEPAKPAVNKPEEPKVNKYCEMKGADFIQKDRKGREEVLLLCLPDYPQKAKIYAEMQAVLDKANGYFTTSETWEAPVIKFLDDYVAGKAE